MTKKILSGCLILAALVVYFFAKKENPASLSVAPKTLVQTPVLVSAKPQTIPEVTPARKPASTGYANVPSKEWETLLTDSLKAQGGDSLKDIKIVKEKSMVWTRDDVQLHAQSVVVTLTNKQEVQSSFRAVVDSQTGKVLETWDQSIFDPADVRGGFRFKLDPRYTN